MTNFLVLIAVLLIISLVLILTKSDFPKLEKIIKRISFYSLIGIIVCSIFLVFDLRFKGKYTTTILGLTFLISTVILFGLTKKTGTKIYSGILTIPLAIFGVSSLIWEMPIIFFYLLAMPFHPPKAKFEIDKKHNIEVRDGGFMACGESLFITETTVLIMDKLKHVGNNSCVTGINKIETLEFKEDKADFLIYHDGKTEFKNPYKYQTEIKNVW
jgi:ABC-2 type transport system permease protein